MALQANSDKNMSRKKNSTHKRKQLKPKTANQDVYIRTICESDVTICVGPAGTGKTSVSVGLACEYLLNKKVEKIIITRPVVETGRKGLGFLPGTFDEKIHPYLVPVLEEMGLYLSQSEINSYRNSKTIEVCPLEYMRGRNFHNSFMILDEAQNTTKEQIKMFITRIGRNSKAVINGDVQQSDLPSDLSGALENCIEKLDGAKGVGIVELEPCDIIRNSIISEIIERLS